MKNKDIGKMKTVLATGTSIASFVYILVGFFGYATFDLYDQIVD